MSYYCSYLLASTCMNNKILFNMLRFKILISLNYCYYMAFIKISNHKGLDRETQRSGERSDHQEVRDNNNDIL